MTLIYFKARSTWVAYVFEYVNCEMWFEGEKLVRNWQMDRILVILEKNGPTASSAPYTGTIIYNIQTFIGIYSRSQVSVYRIIGPLVLMCGPKHCGASARRF